MEALLYLEACAPLKQNLNRLLIQFPNRGPPSGLRDVVIGALFFRDYVIWNIFRRDSVIMG